MPITFGDLDPNRQTRQLENLGQGLGLYLSLKRQREDERRRERESALSRFFDLAGRMPEVAATAGPEIVRKYGSEVPELAGMVSFLQNQGAVTRKVEDAGQSWLSGADRLQQENQESVQRRLALSMPTSPFGMPNLQAFQGAVEASQVHPDTFLQRSAEGMSPSERMAAGIWAKERGLSMPKPYYERRPDPLRDLTQDVRGVYLADQGVLPPDTARSARIKGKLEEGAPDKVRRDLDASRTERANQAAELSRRAQDQRDRSLGIQERQLSLRGSGGGTTTAQLRASRKFLTDTEKALSDRAKERQKAWDAEARQREANLEEIDDLGPRPSVPSKLTPRQANQLVRRATEIATSTPEEEALLEAMVSQYHELVAGGAKPEAAVRQALEMSASPTPPDFGNVQSGVSGPAVPQGAPPAQTTREQLVESTRGIVAQAAQRGITVDERDIEAMVRDLAAGATPEQVLQQLLRGAEGGS